MDAHFNKILAANKSDVRFISSKTFTGRKNDFVFRNGDQGVGYYYDLTGASQKDTESGGRKRPREDDKAMEEDSDGDDDEEEAVPVNSIERMLEEAENSGITQLDSNSLKQLLLSFEKKITKNQKQRMKFPDAPEKFMESELELHAEIQELFVVAASPELYPILVQTGAVNSILGMITHENTDISISTVSLLAEMTDVDSIAEESEKAMTFVDAFVAGQGLELVVQNLSRLDESSEEDAQGVHHSMSILENLVEIRPDLAVTVCEKTHILKYLLLRLKTKQFDANKLYCSEILSILLQSDSRNQVRVCTIAGVDGMDLLLQSIALYRKKEVDALDEQECVENLFLCLSSALLQRENQFKFLACEGFELLVRCMKEQEYAAGCAVSAVSYAIMRNQAACEKLVDAGGLKYVFPLLVGKGFKKSLKRKGTGEKRNFEETVISIIAQLCSLLANVTTNDYSSRLLNKFLESEREKLERCVELYVGYARQLMHTDARLEQERAALVEEGADEEEVEEFDEEIDSQRLDGGLFNMQQLAVAISFAAIFDAECFRKAELRLRSAEGFPRGEDGEEEDGLSMEDVLDTLRSHVLTLGDGATAGDSSSSSDSSKVADEEREVAAKYKQLLTEWCAALSTAIQDRSSR